MFEGEALRRGVAGHPAQNLEGHSSLPPSNLVGGGGAGTPPPPLFRRPCAEFLRFKQHCEFVFKSPLASNPAKDKAGWIEVWIRHEGRDIYETLNWTPGVRFTKRLGSETVFAEVGQSIPKSEGYRLHSA